MSRKATNQILQKAKQLKSDEFHGENIQGYFYFIDESLNKNQNYYKEELQKLSVDYGVPLNLCYGKELFEKLNILQVWDEILNHLARWREILPDLPSLNFDENPLESFKEIKDLAPSVYRKLLDNDGIFNLVLILFPEQKVLKPPKQKSQISLVFGMNALVPLGTI